MKKFLFLILLIPFQLKSQNLLTVEIDTREIIYEICQTKTDIKLNDELIWLILQIQDYRFYQEKSRFGVKIYEFRKGFKSKYFYFLPSNSNFEFEIYVGGKIVTVNEEIKVHTFNRLLYKGEIKKINQFKVK